MSPVTATGLANSVCPQCGAEFRCGMEGGDEKCWCFGLPPLIPLPGAGERAASCLCPGCLQARLRTAKTP